jgi:hypothetical protein
VLRECNGNVSKAARVLACTGGRCSTSWLFPVSASRPGRRCRRLRGIITPIVDRLVANVGAMSTIAATSASSPRCHPPSLPVARAAGRPRRRPRQSATDRRS